ncbi:MAG: 50S ribosomal protein L17 [Elusimicrobia bacterium]|nr:50S ribosomal protein L17 [Elusimicrobiota bacterium]
MNSKDKKDIRNLSYHLIDRGRITTSVSKAKELRKGVERLITRAKKDTLANRRYVAKKIPAKGVKKLFEEIGPANRERNGGYTRILRLEPRQGDAREMCILEIIDV